MQRIIFLVLLLALICPVYALPPGPPPPPPHPHAKIALYLVKKPEDSHLMLEFVVKNVGNAVAERVRLDVSSNIIGFSNFLGDIQPGQSRVSKIVINQSGRYVFHIVVTYNEGAQKFTESFERVIYLNAGRGSETAKTVKPGKVVVSLRSDVTTAKVGQEFSLTLSVVNLISNPNMTLQVVLQPPSGMSIVSSEFAQTGVGQYTGVFHVKPGGAKAIKIEVVPNNPGNFTIKGIIAYYFGNDKKNATVKEVSVPIRVVSNTTKVKKTPGFTAIAGLLALALVAWRGKRWGR